MTCWVKIYPGLLDSLEWHELEAEAAKAAFESAVRGNPCEILEPYIRPGRDRPSGPVWARLRGEIFERDDYTCQYCGERGVRLECDHVIPVSLGGETCHENLVTACFPCNRSKRNRTPEEWRGGA